MEVLYPRCAGLDVHKATVVAGVRLVAGGKVVREVRTFGTTTAGLLELAAWLGGERLHPRRDGGDRRLLEAGLARPGRGRVRPGPGQRGAGQERARPQDRRQRRGLAGGAAGARPRPRELRPGRADGGAARAPAHPQAARPREGQPHASGCRRRSRTPTSSSTRCSPTCWARAGGRCSRPWRRARTIPPSWRRSPTRGSRRRRSGSGRRCAAG